MPSSIAVYRVAACSLWALALWHAWECRGLFVDGAIFMSQIAASEWFFAFYAPRVYAMILGQIPVVTAIKLGVTDLHWLSRLLSLGLFGLPAIFYFAALRRVRHDPMLLALVLAAIGAVFYTTSFFIVGEYNTLYGMMMLAAAVLATSDRLTLRDGAILALIGFLALRTYEAALYLAPIVAAMIIWRVWSAVQRPFWPTLLYLASVVCLCGGFAIALDSILVPWDAQHRDEAATTIVNFWQNMQFLLALFAALTVVIWGLLRPADLLTARPYLWASIWIVLLAFSPLLGLTESQVRPLAKSQYVARTMGGGVVSAIIVVMWIYAGKFSERLAVVRAMRDPVTGRNLLALSVALFLAVHPSDLYLTATWSRYLDAFRTTVQGRTGLIPYEETPLATRPHILLVENWTVPSSSLVFRATRRDGVVLPPKDFKDWQPYNPAEGYPDLGRYFWRN